MDDLSPNARTLLAQLRNDELLNPVARVRVRRALQVSLGKTAGLTLLGAASVANASGALAAAAPAPAATALGAAGAGAVGATTLVQLATSVLIGALAGVGVMVPASYLARDTQAPPSPVSSATTRSATAHAPRPLIADPVSPRSSSETAVKAASPSPLLAARSEARVPSDDTLASETRWLERARGRLKAGQAEESLKLLEQYEQAFPKGILGEEAAASKVVALCASGRTSEAERESLKFQAVFPGSPLRPRVAAACGGALR